MKFEPNLKSCMDECARLEAENARLKQQNEGLLTWAKQFKEERDRLEQELVALSGEK